MKIRVVLADPNSGLAESNRATLALFPTISVDHVTHGADQLLRILDGSNCDVLVTELLTSPSIAENPFDFLQVLRERYPDLKIILQTQIENSALLGLAMPLGMAGLISKRDAASSLPTAVFAAQVGSRYHSPQVLARAPRGWSGNAPWCPRLSKREIVVLKLHHSGLKVSQIATYLERSIKTVSTQKNSAMQKLQELIDGDLKGENGLPCRRQRSSAQPA